ncbi:MAG: DUF962 domain-containing protein [Deltaproteobacteria bacterium]|nr:DUF962 domain-containing protein [Deltaproteobacteria bacterium]
MSRARLPTFAAFWPFYLSQHAVPACRWLHFLGTSAVVASLVYALATRIWMLLPLCLLLGYGPAWVGHFVIEKNRPATFTYPLWSLFGDFRMWGGMLTGRYWTGTPVAPMTEADAMAESSSSSSA